MKVATTKRRSARKPETYDGDLSSLAHFAVQDASLACRLFVQSEFQAAFDCLERVETFCRLARRLHYFAKPKSLS